MSQTYNPPTGSTVMSTAVKTDLPNMADALRSQHSGAGAPSSTVAYMLWADTSTGQLKQRDASNSAWNVVAKLNKDWTKGRQKFADAVSLAATQTWFALCAPEAGKVKRITLLSSTATSSSSGNEWQFGLSNRNTGAQLFSGTVGTFTALGGVGGGAEILTTAAYQLTPNQNDSLAQNDVVEFTMTKVGTATTLVRFAALIEFTEAE